MPDDEAAGVQHVVDAILGYLARNPSAADSEQGITQWWLPQMGVDASVDTVRAALALLVQHGAMTRAMLPGGSVIYRAGPRPPGPEPGSGGERTAHRWRTFRRFTRWAIPS